MTFEIFSVRINATVRALSIFLMVFAWALWQCSVNALSVIPDCRYPSYWICYWKSWTIREGPYMEGIPCKNFVMIDLVFSIYTVLNFLVVYAWSPILAPFFFLGGGRFWPLNMICHQRHPKRHNYGWNHAFWAINVSYLWSVGEMKEFVWLTDWLTDCVCEKKLKIGWTDFAWILHSNSTTRRYHISWAAFEYIQPFCIYWESNFSFFRILWSWLLTQRIALSCIHVINVKKLLFYNNV